jgi:hypothetical protein
MNLALLPFFVLLPVSSGYLEFLAFDTVASLIVIIGVSQVPLPFGMVYFNLFHPASLTSTPIFWIEVIRSLWQGKVRLLEWNSRLSLHQSAEGKCDENADASRKGRGPGG